MLNFGCVFLRLSIVLVLCISMISMWRDQNIILTRVFPTQSCFTGGSVAAHFQLLLKLVQLRTGTGAQACLITRRRCQWLAWFFALACVRAIHWYICTHTCQCIRLYACSEIQNDSIFFSFFLVSSNSSKSKLLTTRPFRYKEYQNQTYPYNYSPIPNRELCFSFLDSRSLQFHFRALIWLLPESREVRIPEIETPALTATHSFL